MIGDPDLDSITMKSTAIADPKASKPIVSAAFQEYRTPMDDSANATGATANTNTAMPR